MDRRSVSKALLALGAGPSVARQDAALVPALGVDVRHYGVVGDGKAADTAAMLKAIEAGQPLDIGNLKIRITSRLTFNKTSQYVYGRGGSFLFDGPPTDRLIDITASDVRFQDMTFDGNDRQVKACLVYCASAAARPKFLRCRFTNIHGRHIGGHANAINAQYGVMISPYAVEGFDFASCLFDEIYNDNSVNPYEGGGYCGGIFFLTDDFAQPDTPQTLPTSGQIHDCLFRNIKTLLPDGLTIAEQQRFVDADGIRLYGSSVIETYLHVSIHDCVFYDCAKRAIKGARAAGVKVSNINVIATASLKYAMVTAVKIDGDDFQLRGMNVYSPPRAPIMIVIQTHDCANIRVDGVFADRCGEFWSMVPTSKEIVIRGWRVSNLRCSSLTPYGDSGVGVGICADTLAESYEDCIFENVTFERGPGDHPVLAGRFVANTPRVEVVLRGWRIVNGDLQIAGSGFTLEGVYHEINDPHYHGYLPALGVLEAGQRTPGAAVRDSIVAGYTVNIKAIARDYLTATRQYFTLIYGDRTRVRNFNIRVPETSETTFPHAQFDGSDFTVENLDYAGPGAIGINLLTSDRTKSRVTLDALRRGGGTASTSAFLHLHLSQECMITNVTDYRQTSQPSIIVHSGTARGSGGVAYLIDGVHSSTSNAAVVADATGVARPVRIEKF